MTSISQYSVIPSSTALPSSEILPDEILIQVFGHSDMAELLSCGKVCKQWYNVSSDDSLWSRFFQNYKEPLKTKQEVLAKFDGAITSETQLLERLEKFIKAAPFGQNQVQAKVGFHCEFPFNPECTFTFLFSDSQFYIAKKGLPSIAVRVKPFKVWFWYGPAWKPISSLPFSDRCRLIFAKALPSKEDVRKELGSNCDYSFCSGWENGLAYIKDWNWNCVNVDIYPGLLNFLIKQKCSEHPIRFSSIVQADSEDFNKTLVAMTRDALKERSQAIFGAPKSRSYELILATSVAIVAVGVFAVYQFFAMSENQP